MKESSADIARSFRWGIWGTGDVSRKFALGLRQISSATPAWVLSRDQSRASDLAARLCARDGFADPATAFAAGADAVYIATPAQFHADHAVRALAAGLPVLVEKPFAANASDARRIVVAARESGQFAMEALWTRFLPAIRKARLLLSEGAIGTPRLLRGEFCIATAPGGSLYHPEGGGALRQRGIYALSPAAHLLGFPEEASAMLSRAPSGVDQDVVVQLRHPAGALSQIRASLRTTADNMLEILGDRGALRFEGRIWRPAALRLVSYTPRAYTSSRLADFRESALGQAMQRVVAPFMAGGGRRAADPRPTGGQRLWPSGTGGDGPDPGR